MQRTTESYGIWISNLAVQALKLPKMGGMFRSTPRFSNLTDCAETRLYLLALQNLQMKYMSRLELPYLW